MMEIFLFPLVGAFAENKDIARDIRLDRILPALKRGEEVVIDFSKINAATQSFIHALISDVIRSYGSEVLTQLSFRSCNANVQQIIEIVVDYMQGGGPED